MKEAFFQYNMKKNGTIDSIIKDGLIILDANALLNAYRFSKDNRDKYFELLDVVNDRLFLTHQSVQEFYNNRLTIIYNKSKFKENLKQELNKKLIEISNMLENNNFKTENNESCKLLKHEQNLKDNLIEILNKTNEEIESKINLYNVDIDKSFINGDDPIIDKLLCLFQNKVNKTFSKEELEQMFKSGKERYEAMIPPGYEDCKSKPEPERYGDFIIWKEIISIAKEKKKDILFVSDDRKEDWCEKFKGYDLGPRKELIKEFFIETNQNFHSITTKEFIKYISDLYTIKGTKDLEKESAIIQRELIDVDLNENKSNWFAFPELSCSDKIYLDNDECKLKDFNSALLNFNTPLTKSSYSIFNRYKSEYVREKLLKLLEQYDFKIDESKLDGVTSILLSYLESQNSDKDKSVTKNIELILKNYIDSQKYNTNSDDMGSNE